MFNVRRQYSGRTAGEERRDEVNRSKSPPPPGGGLFIQYALFSLDVNREKLTPDPARMH